MKKLKIIILSLNFILIVNLFGQLDSSSDENGNLQFTGVIKTKNNDNFELSECISNSAMILGIESKTKSEKEAKKSSYVKGNYAYAYYVDDYESEAGRVKFTYEYIVKNGQIHYRLFNFEHEQSKSKFESVGLLTEKWNKKIKSSFTKKQYAEIMTDLRANAANAIRMIKKYCAK